MNKVRCLAIYFILIAILVWAWFYVAYTRPAIKRISQAYEVAESFDDWVNGITSMKIIEEGIDD